MTPATLTTTGSQPQTAQLTLKLAELAPQRFRHGEYEVRFEAEIAGQRFERRFDSEFGLERGGILRVQVDPDLQDVDIAIRAFQINSDDSETRIDLDPVLGDVEFNATYDTHSDRLIPAGNLPAVNENQRLLSIVQNETSDADGSIEPGLISLKVAYDPADGDEAAAPALKTVFGSNQAERIGGTGVAEIIAGRGKRDVIRAKGGDDILLGGGGNDLLVGGSGDDLLDGGVGNDKYRGNGGSDTFVIAAGQGRDRILDFEDGVDVIGLDGDLTFDDLSFRQRGSNVLIRLGNEALAVVKGVDAAQLTRQDFTTVGYTPFDGIDLPVAVRS